MTKEKPDLLDRALTFLDQKIGRHVRPQGPRDPRNTRETRD